MRLLFGALVALHGTIHLLGVAKAFGARSLPLQHAISRPLGLLWLLGALLFLTAAIAIVIGWGSWWWLLLPALLLSQGLILSVFSDAKYGSLANAVIVLPLLVAMLDRAPSSYRAQYADQVATRIATRPTSHAFSEGELAALPPSLRKYLQVTGASDFGHVTNVRVRMRGEIRRSVDANWMPFEAEQYDFFDRPARLFYLRAKTYGVPFDALHVYSDGHATMRAKAAALLNVVDARGPEMDQSETVTLFNDMCLLAPASLVGAPIEWQELDAKRLRGTLRLAGQSVSALLWFNDAGELENFTSEDRYLSSDGKRYQKARWSTPVRAYRDFQGRRVASYGEASWALPNGEFAYVRMNLLAVEYDAERDLRKGSTL